jgi:hypothetical protein
MIRYFEGRPDQDFLRPNQAAIHPETIYANCLVLIVLLLVASFQQWRGLAGCYECQKWAVFNNIYEGILVILSLMVVSGHDGM